MSLEYLLFLYIVATAASWLIPLHEFPLGLDNHGPIELEMKDKRLMMMHYVYRYIDA